jgi:hypothetical protein
MTLGCGAGRYSPETVAAGHLVVVYRSGFPATASSLMAKVGAQSVTPMYRLRMASFVVNGNEAAAIQTLLADPSVATVLHDRIVTGHTIVAVADPVQTPIGTGHLPLRLPLGVPEAEADSYYNSPQGWAVLAAGGYGAGIAGGAATGPWNTTVGAGIRIAVLDSGVDATHPDMAPNLALNLSEVDTNALPSPCDDGTPQDQSGHGTFTASLAAAAIGGGQTIGVAPSASLLNIKVIERMPATTGADLTTQCENGQPSGLLSWVLLGIEDAIAQHANVIELSLGALVDTSTGDGAGWQAQFDAATYAAEQAGAVVVAAVGNDAENLGAGTIVELPAQARGVLPVVASTNPACAENLAADATCVAGNVTRSSYSNFGVTGAIAAPGGSDPLGSSSGISGFVRGACSEGLPNTADGLPADGESFGCFGLGHTPYVQAIGSSASAALVAGAAADLEAAHPDWSAAQIVHALQTTASKLPGISEPELNLSAALAATNPAP